MSWEYGLFLAAAAAVLGAVFYFSMRSEKPPEKRRGKEPSFGGRKPSGEAEDKTEVHAEEKTAQTTGDAPKPMEDGIKIPQKTPSVRPQGALPMRNFTPPDLPPPPETLLPLDMCYAVRLYGEQQTAAAGPLSLARDLQPAKTKNSYLLGFDDSAGQWRLFPEDPCRYWILAVPLADRGGPVGKQDILRMEECARAFAEKAGMHPVFPSSMEALDNAAKIDRFCAAVDVLIELRLTGEERPPERIGEVMRLVGMTADGARSFVRRANSEEWFRSKIMPPPASGAGARQTIIFEMDAPNISDPPRAFQEMMRAVRRAAAMLDMQVADRQGAEIDEERAAAMREKLSLLTVQMREFGAAPGGATARLIFS